MDKTLPLPKQHPPRATANLQQQVVLEDALNGFQQKTLQRQRVVELGLALLQPQGCRRRQRQLSEEGQGAGGTVQVSAGPATPVGWAGLGGVGEWPGSGMIRG